MQQLSRWGAICYEGRDLRRLAERYGSDKASASGLLAINNERPRRRPMKYTWPRIARSVNVQLSVDESVEVKVSVTREWEECDYFKSALCRCVA